MSNTEEEEEEKKLRRGVRLEILPAVVSRRSDSVWGLLVKSSDRLAGRLGK